jgi:Flp pilus assembly protein TadD
LCAVGRRREAISPRWEATGLAPRTGPAHSAGGGARASAGRTAEAEIHLQQALTLDPADEAARVNLSRLQRR